MPDSHAARRIKDGVMARVDADIECARIIADNMTAPLRERADRAETARAVMAGALEWLRNVCGNCGCAVDKYGSYNAVFKMLREHAEKALTNLDPSVERIQKIVKAAEAIAEEHAKATAALNVNQPSYGPWKDYAHPPCECDICKAVREKGE